MKRNRLDRFKSFGVEDLSSDTIDNKTINNVIGSMETDIETAATIIVAISLDSIIRLGSTPLPAQLLV